MPPSEIEQAFSTELADAVHGVASPFACGGAVTLDEPISLRFRDGATVTVAPASQSFEQEHANEPLVARGAPARFGKGRRTLRDRDVRDAVQIDAAGGAFEVLHFDPAASGLLEEIRTTLAPGAREIRAELYALNVYGERGHFRPHKDTPRGPGMLGTLVVCLPSHFYGGQLLVVHRGAFRVFDWGDEIQRDPDPKKVRWAAFFGDVDHAIERVRFGSRVTLSYVLRCDEEASLHAPAERPEGELLSERLGVLLASPKLMPAGGVLAFPCYHMYGRDRRLQTAVEPITRRSASTLKGRDLTIALAALDRGLEVTLHPYLTENCADETWDLERFPTDRERASLGERLDPWDLEELLPLASEARMDPDPSVRWVIPPPAFNETPKLYRIGADEPGPPHVPTLEYLHACAYSSTGYFGNEGGDVEFYMYAALHVLIPPLGEGPRAGRAPRSISSKKPAKKPAKEPAKKPTKKPAKKPAKKGRGGGRS